MFLKLHRACIKERANNIHTLGGDNGENKCQPRPHFDWPK